MNFVYAFALTMTGQFNPNDTVILRQPLREIIPYMYGFRKAMQQDNVMPVALGSKMYLASVVRVKSVHRMFN
jgi:hypothetical protein